MKYKDTGFRAVYKQFCAFELNDIFTDLMKDYPGINEANCVLTYGYMDQEAGITLDCIAAGQQKGHSFSFADTKTDVQAIIRIGSVSEVEFSIIDDEDGSLYERYHDKLDMLSTYDAPEEVEKTRNMGFLDKCRHDEFIDDIMVYLTRDGFDLEGCWTRIIGLGEHWIMGKLLNEPDQDFGYHEGEEIAFFVDEVEDGSYRCYSDMNPSKILTEKDLEGGAKLKEAVAAFNKEQNQENFFEILELLRDSYVWIPCNAILSEQDQKKWDEVISSNQDDMDSLIGQTLTNEDEIRLVPDILQNGEEFFFPIFSSAEEMGEYGEQFSKVEKHMLEAIMMARSNDDDEKKISGIVLNAFSEPFVIHNDLFEVIENMKTRIVENKADIIQ